MIPVYHGFLEGFGRPTLAPTHMATVRSMTSPWALGAWSAAKGLRVRGSRVLFENQEALLAQRSLDSICGED